MDNLNLGENIKKLLLAGVGAAVTTAEKSREILDDLVEKGALTVEQGKMINEELKHNIKETVKEHRAAKDDAVLSEAEAAEPEKDTDAAVQKEVLDMVGKMTPEEVSALLQQLKAMEAGRKADDEAGAGHE